MSDAALIANPPHFVLFLVAPGPGLGLCAPGRYAKNKTDDVHMAWFNGAGYVPWENVWGAWNGITPRDGEALRRMGLMLRFWGGRGFLQSPDWEPHAAGPVQYGVYASKWPGQPTPATTGASATLWTLVNRCGKNITGPQLKVAAPALSVVAAADTAAAVGERRYFYDCYHGGPLTLAADDSLAFDIEAGGFGCVVELPAPADAALLAHLALMRNTTRRPLSSYDATWAVLQQKTVARPRTAAPVGPRPPPGTVLVPRGNFTFKVSSVMVEGTDAMGAGVQYVPSPRPTPRLRARLCT